MEEAHCDRTEFLSSYPLNIDEIMLIPGSLGRIRPREPKSTTCKPAHLNSTQWQMFFRCKTCFIFLKFPFPDDPKVVVANLTVSNKCIRSRYSLKQTETHSGLLCLQGSGRSPLYLLFQCKMPAQHFKPYLKRDLPKRLHYANNRRIEDVHLLMERKWHIAR